MYVLFLFYHPPKLNTPIPTFLSIAFALGCPAHAHPCPSESSISSSWTPSASLCFAFVLPSEAPADPPRPLQYSSMRSTEIISRSVSVRAPKRPFRFPGMKRIFTVPFGFFFGCYS